MIFVDTSGWFASIVPSDQDHAVARRWFSVNSERLVTTDYIVDETLTLLFRARGEHVRALELADQFLEADLTEIIYLDEDAVKESLSIFKNFADKDWSFTDCSSKYICAKFGFEEAISFDKHFKQFGSLTILP